MNNSEIKMFLENILDKYKYINSIYPVLDTPYLIGIIEEKDIFCFEYNKLSDIYEYIFKYRLEYALSKSTAAAFPINNKICCVLGENIIKSKVGLAYIFHEFFHCYQYENYEKKVKNELGIKPNSGWEIKYEFNFYNKEFSENYLKAIKAMRDEDLQKSLYFRKKSFEKLTNEDIRYIIFNEWKEGLARFYENKIRKLFKITINHYYKDIELDATIFYEYGSLYFENKYEHIPENLHDAYQALKKQFDTEI